MNNLHRDLAPVSGEAWEEIEEEARRTFTLHLAGRRVVDLSGPAGPELAAVGSGHQRPIDPVVAGTEAQANESRPVVELRVPFTLSRREVDNVERGSKDADWQPVKEAARSIALAEDTAIFQGWQAAGITGVQTGADNPPITLPDTVVDYPDAVSHAITTLRLAGVDGPYSLLLGAELYTAVNETSNHGYPVRQHLARVVTGEIIWAPALSGAVVLSTRGGDFELHLGQDLSIGYLSHDAESVRLYLQESLTFSLYSPEAAVALKTR
ncbi:family 1 encapsulin nanocompartment shell protein [Kitasatospora viridis]|uniref:Type 1 encapsulin shell protein n=1 Tax=Kitasatospora viridis TaxID=281105 RepID=A0A561TTU7_9ACTN|nr:family 1 encapsulin nanocompartment shell protein [Kitasatospora viridis]TWF90549.1 putative linocin/CFP29 family protein [Kitasatospora viridis]